jgi:hypothetical protein|nr:MAG TPA: hypothetical protein [Caudoviricetes sp.]
MPETKNTTVDDLITPPAADKEVVTDSTTKVESVKSEKRKTTDTKAAEKKDSATKKSDDLKVTKEIKSSEDKPVVTEKQIDVDMRGGTGFEIPKHARLRVYNTSFTSVYNRTVNGKWYIYADGIVNGRIRITDAAYKVEEPRCCCGWVTVESIAKYITRI